MLAALLGEEIAIELIIRVREEHGLAPVSPLRDVVGQAGDDEAGDAGHGSARLRDFAAVDDRVWGLSKVSP